MGERSNGLNKVSFPVEVTNIHNSVHFGIWLYKVAGSNSQLRSFFELQLFLRSTKWCLVGVADLAETRVMWREVL